MLNLLERNFTPRQIMTREAFENAITVTISLGGSTNALLHLIAMADVVGIPLTFDDFTRIGARTPVLADLRPSGRYLMSELIAIGGVQPLMRCLLAAGLPHGDCLTVTGRTLAEDLANVDDYTFGQDVIRPFGGPVKTDNHIRIFHGNLAPGGAVARITGKEGARFTGTARVFDSEDGRRNGSWTGPCRPATWWSSARRAPRWPGDA